MIKGDYRCWFGLILGGMCGLALGLVSQSINRVLMPSVPLNQPPLGGIANALLCLILGCLLGFITSWPEVGVKGIVLSSLLGAMIISGITLFTGQTDTNSVSQKAFILVFILAQIIAFLSPVFILFRWIVGREELALREIRAGFKIAQLQRWAPSILMILLFGLAGLFAMQNKMARSVLPQMQTLVQTGQQAQSSETLPEQLRSGDVKHFLEQGNGKYVLEWEQDNHNRYSVKRPNSNPDTQSTVVARFENGYLLVCRFPDKVGRPNCKDF